MFKNREGDTVSIVSDASIPKEESSLKSIRIPTPNLLDTILAAFSFRGDPITRHGSYKNRRMLICWRASKRFLRVLPSIEVMLNRSADRAESYPIGFVSDGPQRKDPRTAKLQFSAAWFPNLPRVCHPTNYNTDYKNISPRLYNL